MDVRMPDGTIIRGIPEGTPKEEILAKYNNWKTGRQWKDVPGEALSNVGSNIVDVGKAVGYAVTHPAQITEGTANIAGGAVKEVSPVDEFMMKTTPTLGVLNELLFPGDRKAAKAVGKEMKRQYLTEEGLKETLATRPAESLVDIMSLGYGGTGLVGKAGKAAGLPKLAAGAEKVQKAIVAPVKAVMDTPKQLSKATARKIYKRAVDIPKKAGFEGRRAAVETGLVNKLTLNEKGFEKLKSLKQGYGKQLEKIFTDAEKAGKKVPIEKVFEGLDDIKDSMSMYPETDLRSIEKVIQEHTMAASRRGRQWLTPAEAQKLKTSIYDRMSYDVLGQDYGTQKIGKTMGRTLKESLEEIDPMVGPINQQLGPLKALEEPLYDAAYASRQLSEHPIISTAVGRSVAGNPGAGAGILMSPARRAQTAISLYHMGEPGSLLDLIMRPSTMGAAYYSGRINE